MSKSSHVQLAEHEEKLALNELSNARGARGRGNLIAAAGYAENAARWFRAAQSHYDLEAAEEKTRR